MAHFSIRSVSALVDVISGGPGNDGQPPVGVYRTGAKLVEFFGQCGVEFRPGDRSRVPATRATIDAINEDPEGRAQLEKIIEHCVALRSCNDDEGLWARVVAYLNDPLREDGHELCPVGGEYKLRALGLNLAGAAALDDVARFLDFGTVQNDFAQAQDECERNPAGAVTSACSTNESVCKCVLVKLNRPLPADQDISHLVAAVQQALALAPGQPDLAPDLRQILNGVTTVAGGVGALRTHAGDAHGRRPGEPVADARMARFAVNSACALALFLLETFLARGE